MTLEESIEKSDIILPGHKREFLENLQDFPSGIEKWIYKNKCDATLYQGDILIDTPVCFIDKDGDVIKGTNYVALISNTCDMQPNRKEFLIASRIIFFDDIDYPKEKIKDIKENKIFSFFYLPPQNNFKEGYVDFSTMISINSDYLNSYNNRLLSLSQYGFYLFLIKLTFHLARIEN